MKEIKAILQAYDQVDFTHQQAALATVVRVEGSSYRRIGARMLVIDNGMWVGGISGGCLEGDALRRARLAIHKKQASSIIYDTSEEDNFQIGVNLGCNGVIEVLFTPIDPTDKNNAVELLRNYTEERSARLLFTVIESNAEGALALGKVYREDDLALLPLEPGVLAAIQADAKNALEAKKSKVCSYPGFNLLVEVLPPVIHMVLFGSNYDVFSLIKIGKEIGWKVSVVANIHKISKTLYDAADQVIDKTQTAPIDEYTAFVLMSHDYNTDLRLLETYMGSIVPYIGMLGPRKRAEKIFAELTEKGLEPPYDRIFAPIGLNIGALSPEEIALSIVAEIQAYFMHKKPSFLREIEGVIHERD